MTLLNAVLLSLAVPSIVVVVGNLIVAILTFGLNWMELRRTEIEDVLEPPELPITGDVRILLDAVPSHGEDKPLSGVVVAERPRSPADFWLAIYLLVPGLGVGRFALPGWWTKPYWSYPATFVAGDGTWTSRVRTGGRDSKALRLAVFAVRKGYFPVLRRGQMRLPDRMRRVSVAEVRASTLPKGTYVLSVTRAPLYGCFDEVEGKVVAPKTDELRVVVFIRVLSRWWVKPSIAAPTVPVDNGTWRCKITTRGVDERATQILALLVHRDMDWKSARPSYRRIPRRISRVSFASVRIVRSQLPPNASTPTPRTWR